MNSDEATPEQAAAIERELNRVLGNRLSDGTGPMLLPLISYDEFITLLTSLADHATDAQLRAGLEQVCASRRARLSEFE